MGRWVEGDIGEDRDGGQVGYVKVMHDEELSVQTFFSRRMRVVESSSNIFILRHNHGQGYLASRCGDCT
jgi:hypothetical protein